MVERDTRQRLGAILESLVDLGRLHREHQTLFTEKNRNGQTFLHRPCQGIRRPAVIKIVAELCGMDILKETDSIGDTLNLVCRHEDVPCEAIEILTVPCPEAVQMASHQGWTPLHTAYNAGASVEVVRLHRWKSFDCIGGSRSTAN
jgi:hypothetical protein